MATVIGIISGLMTMFTFVDDNFSDEVSSTKTTMRIVTGLDGTEGLNNAGGDYPDVRLFGDKGKFLGAKYDPGFIPDGTHYDLTIDQKTGQQPTYALFTGNTDAVCIAYIAATWPDNQKYGWVGSWARECGYPWYHSGISIDHAYPECMWLDANGDATDITAFQVHFPDFNPKDKDKEDYNKNATSYCDQNPTFKTYTGDDPSTLYYWISKPDGSHRKTSELAVAPSRDPAYTSRKSRKSRNTTRGINDSRLVKSRVKSQRATELCDSETSFGPDFLSLDEGKFCDMSERKLWDLCDEENGITDDCFDVELNDVQYSNLTTRVEPKAYSKIIEWDGGDE